MGFLKAVALLLFSVAVFWVSITLWSISKGISSADLDKVKAEIRSEYDKKPGFKVREIVLVREDANKASGFVTVETKDNDTFTKPCTAFMSDAGKGYWHCR